MNRLLSLKLRSATDLDVESVERSDEKKKKPLVLESETTIVEISVPEENENESSAPTVEEIKKKVDVTEVKFLSLEEIKKLYSRLPKMNDPEFKGDFFGKEKTTKPLPKNNLVKIKFPTDEQLERSTKMGKVTEVELLIQSFNPSGSVHSLETPLRITFSQPMYKSEVTTITKKEDLEETLKKQAKAISKLITVSPALPTKGIWKFESSTTAAFFPQKKYGKEGLLCGSTLYSVVVPKGIKSVNGNTLKKTLKFTFRTPVIHVKSFCNSSSWPKMMCENPILGLEFSQDVSPSQILKKISLKKKGYLGKKVKLKLLEKKSVIEKVNNDAFYKANRNTNADPSYIFNSSCVKKKILVEKKQSDWVDGDEIPKVEIEVVESFNENVMFFTACERLDADCSYNLKIEKKLEGVRGNIASGNDYIYSFQTMENLRVNYSNIPSEIYEYDKIEWSIDFNNELSPIEYEKNGKKWIKIENVSDAIVWIDKNKIRIKGRIRKGKSKATVRISSCVEDIFKSRLSKDETYKIKINNRKFECTDKPFGKQQCYDNVSWYLTFNQMINKNQFLLHKEKLFTIKPRLKHQKISLNYDYGVCINGNPCGSKTFEILISKELQTNYETELKKDLKIKVSIKEEPKRLLSQHNNKMIIHDITNNTLPPSFRFIVQNMKKIRVLIFKVNPAEDYNKVPFGYFSNIVYDSKKVNIFETVGLSEKKVIFDSLIETKCAYNEKKQVIIPLEKFLNSELFGQLFCVAVHPDDLSKSITTWIQATNLSFETIFSNDQTITLIGNSLNNGKLLSNPEFKIHFYKDKEGEYKKAGLLKQKVLWKNYFSLEKKNVTLKGDENGLCVVNLEKISDFFSYDQHMIVLSDKNDCVFYPGFLPGGKKEYIKSVEVTKSKLISFVFDDKKIYKPKEVINIKGILRKLIVRNKERKLHMFEDNTKLKYIVYDGNKVKFLEGEISIDTCSSFFVKFVIPESANLGDCRINFNLLSEHKDSPNKYFNHYFKIEEYKAPEFDSSCIVFPKSYYINKKALVTASAKYYSGGGMSDCDVKWVVRQEIKRDYKPPGSFEGYNFQIESRYVSSKWYAYINKDVEPKYSYTLNDNFTDDNGSHKLLIELLNPQQFEKKDNYSPKILPNNEKLYTKMKDHNGSEVILPVLYEKSRTVFSPIKIFCKAEIRDISQNVLLCQSDFIVHPCRYYLGLRRNKETKNDPLYLGDTLKDIEMILLNSNGKYIPNIEVQFEVFKNHEKKSDFVVKSNEEIAFFNVRFFEEWGYGSYCIVGTVIDDRGFKNISSVSMYISNRPENDEREKEIKKLLERYVFEQPVNFTEYKVDLKAIKLQLNKRVFFVNDMAKCIAKVPIVGEGIFFIRSTDILYKKKFEVLQCDSEVNFEFKISELYVPNVSVFCYVFGHKSRTDLNSFEITKDDEEGIIDEPSYAKGEISLKIDPKHFELDVKVTPKESVLHPSAESSLTVKVSKGKSVVTCLIVDESILALTGYNLNLPIKHFYPDNLIKVFEFFMREKVFLKRWNANKKKIEEDKKKLNDELKEKEEERKKREIELKRREEERKQKELEKRKQMKLSQRQKNNNNSNVPLSGKIAKLGKKAKNYGSFGRKDAEDGDYEDESSSEDDDEEEEGEDIFPEEEFKEEKKSSESSWRRKRPPMKRKPKPQKTRRSRKKKEKKKKKSKKDGKKRSKEEEEDYDDFDLRGDIVEEVNTPIQMRKLFESTVIFANCIITNDKGIAEITYKLPDQLSRFKIWCVAEHSSNYYGLGTSSIVSKLPFNIRPNIPSFLNYGDKADLSFVLSNQTESTLNLKIALRTSSNVTVIDEKKKGFNVVLPRSKRTEVTFPVIANKIGPSIIQIGASGSDYSDAIEKIIPIHSPTTNNSFILYGELNDDITHVQDLLPPLQKDVYINYGGLELQTSSTIFQNLTDSFLYVYKYMYDSVEHSASRIISIISMIDIIQKFNLPNFDKLPVVNRVMKTALRKLSTSQHKNGGFGYWSIHSKQNTYLSIYAAHAVIRVRSAFPVLFDKKEKDNNILLNKCKNYCIGMAKYFPFGYRKNSKQPLRSFSLYVLAHYAKLNLLTKGEKSTCLKRSLKLLKEFGKSIKTTNESKAWLAFSLFHFTKEKQPLKDKNVIKLLDSIKQKLIDKKEYSYVSPSGLQYDTNERNLILLGTSIIRDNAAILEVLCTLNPNDSLLPKLAKYLLKMKRFGKWKNTNENSNVLLALTSYFKIFEKKEPNFKMNVWLKERYCGEITFKGREMDLKILRIPMENIVINEKEAKIIEEKTKIIKKKFESTKEEREKLEKKVKEEEALEKHKYEEEKKKKKKNHFFRLVLYRRIKMLMMIWTFLHNKW